MESFGKGAALTFFSLLVIVLLTGWVLAVIYDVRKGEPGPATIGAVFAVISAIGGFVHWYWF